MSTAKTKININFIGNFLKKNFSPDINTLEFVSGGEVSQAFSFISDGKELIIRANPTVLGFEKDKYAREHFNSDLIPVPKTISAGKLNNTLYYSITEKAKGKALDKIPRNELQVLIPEMLKTMDAIHAIDIRATTGFGDWDENGKGENASWNEYLIKIIDEFKPSHPKFDSKKDILEMDVTKKLVERYKELLQYCPEDRYLVHGDFGFANGMTAEGKITGVFDWEMSCYGDFLHDIAWLNFWEPEIFNLDLFIKHYQEKGITVSNFQERILCYKLHHGLGSLSWYAGSDQREKYKETQEYCLKLLN
ncbi:MAG: aminoglycoside phosphotransferase family protein [Patescibacteria group bacterium]|nr:aminoglycoside phosphotransferase family protein [Patescibacteria group bacterium]